MIIRPKTCIGEDGLVSPAALSSVIAEHQRAAQRYRKLRGYYDGDHAINSRIRPSGLPNAKLTHAFPRYITTMAAGYLIGNPVSYAVAEEGKEGVLDDLMAAYDKMNADSIDAELAKQASICGKGVELLYANEDAEPRTATIDPCNGFVVYDDTVEHRPLFGVHYFAAVSEKGEKAGFHITVCLPDRFARYAVQDVQAIHGTPEITPHYFGGVPLVEYWNTEDEQGDFECVVSLVDAYNLLQSDRINDKQQFVDALLVVTGCVLEEDEPETQRDDQHRDRDKRSPGQKLREEGFITLPSTDADVKWLYKQLREADVEVLKDALKTDIHKMSMVPDLTDHQFAGNSSGVAMRYKLMGLEQITKIKERWFREGLRTRMRLFAAFLAAKGKPALDTDAVQITFTRTLPTNELETAQMVQTLQGMVPDELLLKQLPFVSDVDGAMELLAKQRAEEERRQAALYGPPYPDANRKDSRLQEEA